MGAFPERRHVLWHHAKQIPALGKRGKKSEAPTGRSSSSSRVFLFGNRKTGLSATSKKIGAWGHARQAITMIVTEVDKRVCPVSLSYCPMVLIVQRPNHFWDVAKKLAIFGGLDRHSSTTTIQDPSVRSRMTVRRLPMRFQTIKKPPAPKVRKWRRGKRRPAGTSESSFWRK